MFQVDQVLPVFFEAMRSGYVNNPLKMPLFVGDTSLDTGMKIITVPVPGAKVVVHKIGEFTVMDCWFTSPNSAFSSGFTNIWHEKALVWQMQYQGWYRKEAIPFLKEALKVAYDANQFVGGRGPNVYKAGGFSYSNDVIPFDENNAWHRFHGREHIIVLNTGELVGCHDYQGLLMC